MSEAHLRRGLQAGAHLRTQWGAENQAQIVLGELNTAGIGRLAKSTIIHCLKFVCLLLASEHQSMTHLLPEGKYD